MISRRISLRIRLYKIKNTPKPQLKETSSVKVIKIKKMKKIRIIN